VSVNVWRSSVSRSAAAGPGARQLCAQRLRIDQISLVGLVDRGFELVPAEARGQIDQGDDRRGHRNPMPARDLEIAEQAAAMDDHAGPPPPLVGGN